MQRVQRIIRDWKCEQSNLVSLSTKSLKVCEYLLGDWEAVNWIFDVLGYYRIHGHKLKQEKVRLKLDLVINKLSINYQSS